MKIADLIQLSWSDSRTSRENSREPRTLWTLSREHKNSPKLFTLINPLRIGSHSLFTSLVQPFLTFASFLTLFSSFHFVSSPQNIIFLWSLIHSHAIIERRRDLENFRSRFFQLITFFLHKTNSESESVNIATKTQLDCSRSRSKQNWSTDRKKIAVQRVDVEGSNAEQRRKLKTPLNSRLTVLCRCRWTMDK